jgi:glyoxylase-like metal-dependent hydrolase (beta-lactamase superfamily II)/ferredoxin
MAQLSERLPQNVPGDFFVDSTCIDCDACRQIAPAVFQDHGDQSSVYHQPANPGEVHRALMALVACPTGSIGTTAKQDVHLGTDSFPTPVAENVFFCGFTAESSFGAWSYLITRPDTDGGNVLVDCPRWTQHLVRKIEGMGGIRTMLLSHRDDIADHVKYARHFGCPRVMHADDGAERLGIERIVSGAEPSEVAPQIVAIPTPGHTRGHVCYLYRDKFLFTGDHLAWSPNRETLIAFRDACWYSWSRQTESMARLLDYRFEWVLPGHGRIHRAIAEQMHVELEHCVEWMRETR